MKVFKRFIEDAALQHAKTLRSRIVDVDPDARFCMQVNDDDLNSITRVYSEDYNECDKPVVLEDLSKIVEFNDIIDEIADDIVDDIGKLPVKWKLTIDIHSRYGCTFIESHKDYI